jgi:hypothetical protein
MRSVFLAVAATAAFVTGCGDSSSIRGKQSQAEKTAGAIRAVEDALAGKSVKVGEYGTTEDEIFVVFKAKIAQITEQVRRNSTESGLASAKSDSERLLRAMERVNPNRTDTIELRKSCKELGIID